MAPVFIKLLKFLKMIDMDKITMANGSSIEFVDDGVDNPWSSFMLSHPKREMPDDELQALLKQIIYTYNQPTSP